MRLLTCFKLNINVFEIVMGQYLVFLSSLALIFSAGPSASTEVRFKGTNSLFFMKLPKSWKKVNKCEQDVIFRISYLYKLKLKYLTVIR